MDFKKLLESFSYDERQLLFRLLRSEFEKPDLLLEEPSRERDKDLTVEEWLKLKPDRDMSTRLVNCLNTVRDELIVDIDGKVPGMGGKTYFELIHLRGYE